MNGVRDKMRWCVVQGLSAAVALVLVGCSGDDGPPGPPGPVGPAGSVGAGALEGRVEVWEDLFSSSQTRGDISAGGVTIMLVGPETTLFGETDFQGRYRVDGVPAGVYTVVAFKDSASAAGYGNVREHNIFVGNGVSFFSPDLTRKALPPASVQVGAATDAAGAPLVEITWTPGDAGAIHEYRVWVAPADPETGEVSAARALLSDQLLALRLRIFLAQLGSLLGAGTYYFGVSADNGNRYFDVRLGRFVNPSESAVVWTAEPAVIEETQPSPQT